MLENSFYFVYAYLRRPTTEHQPSEKPGYAHDVNHTSVALLYIVSSSRLYDREGLPDISYRLTQYSHCLLKRIAARAFEQYCTFIGFLSFFLVSVLLGLV